jgi:hypothetical protein
MDEIGRWLLALDIAAVGYCSLKGVCLCVRDFFQIALRCSLQLREICGVFFQVGDNSFVEWEWC